MTILSDNNTLIDQYLLGEPGFSCLIEAEGKRFLLDTGYFGVFARNAEALGIRWRDVDGVVLSHCHDDHTKGLEFFFTEGPRPKLVAHPLLFRRVVSHGLSIGCPYPREQVERYFDLELTDRPLALTENLFIWAPSPGSSRTSRTRRPGRGTGSSSRPTTRPWPIAGKRGST